MPKGQNQKFTMTTAEECVKLLKSGARTRDLCKKYNCSTTTIADIKFNKTWRNITREPMLRHMNNGLPMVAIQILE